MISCIIFTHADLGSGLKNAVEGMMGKQEAFSVLSNAGMGREEMISALNREILKQAQSEGVVVFVDMAGGSCWNMAKKIRSGVTGEINRKSDQPPPLAIICGVNLPMLVKFFSLRNDMPLDRLVPLVRQEGEKGIVTEH
jgi:mannose/fructose-specific phosphotransferase system component IIA